MNTEFRYTPFYSWKINGFSKHSIWFVLLWYAAALSVWLPNRQHKVFKVLRSWSHDGNYGRTGINYTTFILEETAYKTKKNYCLHDECSVH